MLASWRWGDEGGKTKTTVSSLSFSLLKSPITTPPSLYYTLTYHHHQLPASVRHEQTWLAQMSGGVPLSANQKYTAGLYWAGMTITSIGYGDIYPTNEVERVVCTVLMVLSGL